MARRLEKSFTHQEPIPEQAIECACEILRSGRLHRPERHQPEDFVGSSIQFQANGLSVENIPGFVPLTFSEDDCRVIAGSLAKNSNAGPVDAAARARRVI